jgi:hypothetical protein
MPERPPLFYARVAGFIYLLAMALGIFSQGSSSGKSLPAMQPLRPATSRTMRVSVVTFVTDVVIAWAFYELLKTVDRSLALLGALLRVADGAILAVTTFAGLITLRLLSGAAYLHSIPVDQLESLARVATSARGLAFYVGFVFLGLGSTIFAYLLFKSRYVPRILAGWGIFASILLAGGSLGVILSSWFADHLSMAFMVPMFFYEVPLGVWLLTKGVRLPPAAAALVKDRCHHRNRGGGELRPTASLTCHGPCWWPNNDRLQPPVPTHPRRVRISPYCSCDPAAYVLVGVALRSCHGRNQS